MSLKSTTKTDVNTVELVFEVSPEDFEAAVERAYQRARKRISVPGFRKGKVSRKMAETYMGQGVFYEDAMNLLINQELPAALQNADFELVDTPQVSAEKISKEEGATFKAVCITKPVVEISDYKGIKASRTVKEVTDADVDAQLNILRQRNARLVSVDDRAAQIGDEVNIDFEGFFGDEAFEGGKGDSFPLTLGSGQFIPGFEEQIVGRSIGDEFDVSVTFPENYQMAEYAGKDAVFKCKLNGITVQELPEADDEFIQDATEFDTLEEYRKSTRENLESTAVRDADIAFDNAIMEAIIAKVTVPIPNCMYEHRIDDLVRSFENMLSQQGMSLDLYLQYTGMDMTDFREQNYDRAVNEVKLRLALEKIAELENIQITDEEVDESLKELVESSHLPLAEVKRRLPMEDYITDMRVTKALEIVKANADTTAEETPAEEEAPAEESAE